MCHYKLISLLLIATSLMAIRSISSSGSPPARKTGAPGEGLCFNCHNLGVLNAGGGAIEIDFPNGDSVYMPDSTYQVQLTVRERNAFIFGFSMTTLDADTNQAGKFIVTDSTVTTIKEWLDRSYLSHRDALNNFNFDTLTWTFQWQAPSAGTGPVDFYTAGVAANSAISIATGNVYTQSLRICEDSCGLIRPEDTITPPWSVHLFPNPSAGNLNVGMEGQTIPVEILVYDVMGALRRTSTIAENQVSPFSLDLRDLGSGEYFIFLRHGTSSGMQRLVITHTE